MDDTIINTGHNISSHAICIIALKSIILPSSELSEDYNHLLSLCQSRQIQSNLSRSLQLKTTRQLFVIFVPWRRCMRCFHVNVRDLSQIRVTLLTNIATLLLEGCCPSIKVMDGLDGAHCVELCGHFYHC